MREQLSMLQAEMAKLRAENASTVAEVGQLQARVREAEGSAASAVKEAAKANADAVAARQAESAAKEEGRRHELQVTELKVTVAAKEEYLQILQKDRERLRDPKSRGASTVNSPKAEGDRPGEVAALQKRSEMLEREAPRPRQQIGTLVM